MFYNNKIWLHIYFLLCSKDLYILFAFLSVQLAMLIVENTANTVKSI